MGGATGLVPPMGMYAMAKRRERGAARGTHRVCESETVTSLEGEKTAAFQCTRGKRPSRIRGSRGLLPAADAVIEAEDFTTRSGGNLTIPIPRRSLMKKLIPAVFFQKHLDGIKEAPKKPERLELFESELRKVAGGRPILGPPNEYGGYTTYSYSDGWADVLQADDCAA